MHCNPARPLQESPWPSGPGIPKRVSRGLPAPWSKKCPKESRNSLQSLKIDCFETLETVLTLFRTLFGPRGQKAPETLLRLFRDSEPGGPWRLLQEAGGVAKHASSCRKVTLLLKNALLRTNTQFQGRTPQGSAGNCRSHGSRTKSASVQAQTSFPLHDWQPRRPATECPCPI